MSADSEGEIARRAAGEDAPTLEAASIYRDIIRIQERSKIIRTAIVGVVALGGLYIVGQTIQAFVDTPPWLQALALLAGTVPPSIWMWRIRAQFRMYMERDHNRVMALEAKVDASRTSSGINPDGTSPHGT